MAEIYAFITPEALAGAGPRVPTLRQGGRSELLADLTYDPDDGDSWPAAGVGASEQTVNVVNDRTGASQSALLCPLV